MPPVRVVQMASRERRQELLEHRHELSAPDHLFHVFGVGDGEPEPRSCEAEVSFEPVAGPINDAIDDAYRAKYRDSPYLTPMIGPRARAATMRVLPREA